MKLFAAKTNCASMFVSLWIVIFASVCYAYQFTNISTFFSNEISNEKHSYAGYFFPFKYSSVAEDARLTVVSLSIGLPIVDTKFE